MYANFPWKFINSFVILMNEKQKYWTYSIYVSGIILTWSSYVFNHILNKVLNSKTVAICN